MLSILGFVLGYVRRKVTPNSFDTNATFCYTNGVGKALQSGLGLGEANMCVGANGFWKNTLSVTEPF